MLSLPISDLTLPPSRFPDPRWRVPADYVDHVVEANRTPRVLEFAAKSMYLWCNQSVFYGRGKDNDSAPAEPGLSTTGNDQLGNSCLESESGVALRLYLS